MAIRVDFSKAPDSASHIHDGNGDRVSPGRGMAIIKEFNEDGGAKGQAHELVLEIAAWSVDADRAKVHKENIFTEDKSGKGWPMRKLIALALASGLFSQSDYAEFKKNDATPDLDFSKVIGRPIMIELVEEPRMKDPSKMDIKIGNAGLGYYHIKDTKCKDWPKNAGIYNQNAAIVGDWTTEKKATEKPATKAAASSDDAFAGVI